MSTSSEKHLHFPETTSSCNNSEPLPKSMKLCSPFDTELVDSSSQVGSLTKQSIENISKVPSLSETSNFEEMLGINDSEAGHATSGSSRSNRNIIPRRKIKKPLTITDYMKKTYSKESEGNDNFETNVISHKIAPNPSWIIIPVTWKKIIQDGLYVEYTRLYIPQTAKYIFQLLEEQVEYFTGDLSKVKVYGKWHNIPRKQAAYGDPGLSYAFSGNCIPALPWESCEIIKKIKKTVEKVCQHCFNFVLVNRYKDGFDHMGEHQDDERELISNSPIASVSFGQHRDFIFKHVDAVKKRNKDKQLKPIKMELENGSLLVMHYPTNKYWYHSVPECQAVVCPRINLTFRDMVKKC